MFLGGTSQPTAAFASLRDQLQVPLGHLLSTNQHSWAEVESHRAADVHTNHYHWSCILIVIQTYSVKCTGFSFMLAGQGLELMLIKDHEGDYAASQWDLYAESHSFFESLPKIIFQRTCITAKTKLMNGCIIEFGCRMRVKFRTVY